MECATPPHVHPTSMSLYVTGFIRPFPAFVLQATNAGVRRPGNEATVYLGHDMRLCMCCAVHVCIFVCMYNHLNSLEITMSFSDSETCIFDMTTRCCKCMYLHLHIAWYVFHSSRVRTECTTELCCKSLIFTCKSISTYNR